MMLCGMGGKAFDAMCGRPVHAMSRNGGQESECGWCKDKWGLNWQITPRALTEAISQS